MAKIEGANRGASVYRADPSILLIIGRDTKDKEGDHFLYDVRAHNPPDRDMVAEMAREAEDGGGVHTPIEVMRDGDHYVVSEGRQRTINLRAANELRINNGLEPHEIPFLLKRQDEVQATRKMLLLNAHRIDDPPAVIAKRANALITRGDSITRVASLLRIDESTLHGYLKLLDCAPEVRRAVDEGKIAVRAAGELSKLTREEQVAQLGPLLASGNATTQNVGRAVRAAQKGKGTAPATPYVTPSMKQVRAVVRLCETDESYAKAFNPAALIALKVLAGKADPKRVKGFLRALKQATRDPKTGMSPLEDAPEEDSAEE